MDLTQSSARALQQLAGFRKLFEPCLKSFLEAKITEAEKVHPLCGEMSRRIAGFTLSGGKRIRPAFVYYGFRCFSAEDDARIVTASIAPELLHSFLLIHDDIIDADEMRRSAPSMFSAYSRMPEARRFRSPEDYGEAMAIIAGDVASALAFDALASSGFPAERLLQAVLCLNKALMDVGYGEALDIHSGCSPTFTEEDAMLVNRMKTGRYTIEAPLHLGAILAGATEEGIGALSRYAEPLGCAFQLQDDILGLFGETEQTGKPSGSDIRQGKRTLLIIQALEMADANDRALIEYALGRPEAADGLLEDVRRAVERSGALGRVRSAARQLIRQAQAELDSALLQEGRDFLFGIAESWTGIVPETAACGTQQHQ